VLVIDDEAPILRALRISLTARQYEVSTAADGTSGLAAMARDRPDVLILDLGLPDMDGTEVIRGVRGWTSTPIIVLSAWGSYLRVYVAQLRRKLEPDPSRPRHLLTEPGMGYRFRP
jgi:DNA-binding response OmpR family regulator